MEQLAGLIQLVGLAQLVGLGSGCKLGLGCRQGLLGQLEQRVRLVFVRRLGQRVQLVRLAFVCNWVQRVQLQLAGMRSMLGLECTVAPQEHTGRSGLAQPPELVEKLGLAAMAASAGLAAGLGPEFDRSKKRRRSLVQFEPVLLELDDCTNCRFWRKGP